MANDMWLKFAEMALDKFRYIDVTDITPYAGKYMAITSIEFANLMYAEYMRVYYNVEKK